jgi:5-oxoprolinase (ATP-hydrolysing) subunit A
MTTPLPHQPTIDMNADLGEGFGADGALLQLVSSANIACGFHAGDPHTMHAAVRSCIAAGVAIGAHPGLPDRIGFGRRDMAITPAEAYDYTLYQVGALDAFVRAADGRLRHVKPHGALYHMAGRDAAIAESIVKAVRAVDDRLAIVAQAGSMLLAAAEAAGLQAVSEAFADRRYRTDGLLVPRSEPMAVIANEAEAAAQAISLASGTAGIKADTICVHGDGAEAVKLAAAIRGALLANGWKIAAPAID